MAIREPRGSRKADERPAAEPRCCLDPEALQARLAWIREHVVRPASRIDRRPAGLRVQCGGAPSEVDALLELIRRERRCCPFLLFRLTLPANDGPVTLEIDAPPFAVDTLHTWFEGDDAHAPT